MQRARTGSRPVLALVRATQAAGVAILGVTTLVACQVASMRPSGSETAPSNSGSHECMLAPEWLVRSLEGGLTVRGATLARAFTVAGSDVTDLPGEVDADRFAHPTWVAAVINGAGVRPEVGLWLVSDLAAGDRATVAHANAAAARYWHGPGSAAVRGAGRAEALACIGPVAVP